MPESIYNPSTGKFFDVKSIVKKESDLPKGKVYLRTIYCKHCRYLIYQTLAGCYYALYKKLTPKTETI